MVPFITCEVSLCQYVCELVFGVNVIDLDLGVQVDSVKQLNKSNSVGSGNMSHRRTSAFDDHLDNCFVIFKDVKHCNLMKKSRLRKQNQQSTIQSNLWKLMSCSENSCASRILYHATGFSVHIDHCFSFSISDAIFQ